jgi:glucokinase
MLFAIDIGGSKIRIVGSQLGNKIDEEVVYASPQNQRMVVKDLQTKIQQVAGRSGVDSIAIAAPGNIDKLRGIMVAPPNLPWRNLKLTSPLSKYFGCPVVLEHDASCGAICEAKLGSGQGLQSFVYVTISTGIGTAIWANGELLATVHHSEGGHMIIEPNYLDPAEAKRFEQLVSGSAIVRTQGHLARDIHSPAVWDDIASKLASGLYNIATLIQPEAFILAGGVSNFHKRFVPRIAQQWRDYPWIYSPPKLVAATHIETAPALGALQLAREATDHIS